MLKKLTIKDYALIDEMSIEFGPGLNILTGETGAGKSIIIGALSLLLGERAKADIIRQGTSMAVVEGLFDAPPSMNLGILGSSVPLEEDGFLLRREVHASGKSRSFANDSPIPQSFLATLGDLLIDLHGQHDHQALLKVDSHLDYLDNFSADRELLESVRESFRRFQSLENDLKILRQKEGMLKEKRELMEFQVQEIEKAHPKKGEEEDLELEEKILRNSERLFQASEQLKALLYGEEGSVSEKIATAEGLLTELKGVDPQFEKQRKECESARITVEEVVNSIQTYISKVEFNPERLEEVRERLGLFTRLKNKHGGSMEKVLEFWEKTKKELETMQTMGEEINQLTEALEEEKKRLAGICEKLSALRKRTAAVLEKQTLVALEELGLKNGRFCIRMEQMENPEGPVQIGRQNYAVTARGVDKAEFFISLNIGEDPKPLAKVASGGEISRIMLALKTVLAEADNVPVLVFDEIDTGISGRIARVVGKNLKEVSKKHQVICITHLPQIASMADVHFCVEKQVQDNRSITRIRSLEKEERVNEIAKLIGGEKVTESALQSARELLTS